MKSIAVYKNQTGEVASLREVGVIHVYNKMGKEWTIVKQIEFSAQGQMGLVEFRIRALALVAELGDCKVFVAKEASGQLYYVLETNGFNIYEAEGRPEDFLESIDKAELEEEKKKEEKTDNQKLIEIPYPEKTEQDGRYFINIKEIMYADPTLTSKKLLLPFLRAKQFECLAVICEHVPRWFESECMALGFKISSDKLGENEYRIEVIV